MSRHFTGRVAVVTGAGSGIGRELALELARRGADLALADIDADAVTETATDATALGVSAWAARVDVSHRDSVVGFAAHVAERFGRVNVVINNAGIVVHAQTVLDSDWADIERVLSVNLHGVIHGTQAFLPHLIASGDGHVVNISSLNGFMAQSRLSAYCASKFAVRGFTEALRAEMLEAGLPVRVTVVHPGGVATGIATRALEEARRLGRPVTSEDEDRVRLYNDKLLRMPADVAARIILDGVARGRPRILVGRDAQVVDAVVRLMPAHYPSIVASLSRRLASTGTHHGA